MQQTSRREDKGRQIAARGGIVRDGIYWRVPSQTGEGDYQVHWCGGTPYCTCPDYELSGLKCKHIYAVQYAARCQADGVTPAEECVKPTTPKRPTYRQDWVAYNAAQTHEKTHFQALLADLCQFIDEPQYTFGRPRHSRRDLIFAIAFKVYSTVSTRRFACDLADAYEKGYLSAPIHHSSVFRALEDADLTAILRDLIEQSALPLKAIETRFAVDSTGFSTCRYVRWYDAKYGREMEKHEWIKAHVMCGVLTNIITSVEVTGAYGADSPQFVPLVKATARHFSVYEVSADKAYSARENLEAVDNAHGRAYIPFRSNAAGRPLHDRKADLWDKFYHFFHLHRETFLEHYHARSLSESTFSMLKAKFGDALRSKTDVALTNELLCKVLCHNICCLIQSMYELGIEPDFLAAGRDGQ